MEVLLYRRETRHFKKDFICENEQEVLKILSEFTQDGDIDIPSLLIAVGDNQVHEDQNIDIYVKVNNKTIQFQDYLRGER